MRSLADLVGEDLGGRTFLDIGAGSGIFSLAALKLGASRVVSIDVDADSVASCEAVREAADSPESWIVLHESILDDELPQRLESADIVYSWGVLHHTGDMDRALRNAAALVRPGGVFCIAVYNRVGGLLSSERWLWIKRLYNRSGRMAKMLLEGAYVLHWSLRHLRRRRNPVREAREYRRARGMALRTDVADWLGGYPYEYATAQEIVELCEHECGLRARTVVELGPRDHGNNEFVFERPPSSGGAPD